MSEDNPQVPNRGLLTICVMAATIMQALATTIANVALPYMQGSLSATQDQITWVLTSYIVAAAIFMPTTGFLAARFGRKKLLITAVAGFTIASGLCGAAQTLGQMVIFRLLQDVFSSWTPQFWQFWIGLVLVLIVLVGRERMYRGILWLPRQLGARLGKAKPAPSPGGGGA